MITKKLLIFQLVINTPCFSIVKIFSAFLNDFIGSGYILGSGRNLYAQILRDEDSFAETGKKECNIYLPLIVVKVNFMFFGMFCIFLFYFFYFKR